jgi:fucose permease
VLLCTPPFPVVVATFFFIGLGLAINLALGNVFAANLHNSGKMLGTFHGAYGIGGILGPLIATSMVSHGTYLLVSFFDFAITDIFTLNVTPKNRRANITF